ncbi:YrhK family protein [Rhizobium helianthi]|uniref:YrhK family protein n=1 Tax=Rhizobium helianthi TaxID=1132695 RepID=A0ABW4M534_9HYPH
MGIFTPGNPLKNERTRHLYALYELIYTAVDLAAAVLFVIGSFLFFSEETKTAGTWCFVVGSIFFAAKPLLRIARELHYWRLGNLDKLAKRAEG